MKRFRLDPGGVGIEERPEEQLPYDEVWALVRAVHRFDSESLEEVKTSKISAGRALATGGLMLTKSVTQAVRSVSHERCGVLYLFRRTGETPWILRETGTNYAALGTARGHSQVQNFGTTVRLLRERMPTAPYDERLVQMKRVKQGDALARPGAAAKSSTVEWTDLLAHVVAYSLSRRSVDPYRT